jgi:alkanesulfonate monooxygenase SsuD/methylene tetrahydromethanopterin reductase-like flavin-dependent oxidoreductase (luciferase family)
MEAWYFTEMPYPDLPPIETLPNMRVTIPNRLYDPRKGAQLYHRYLDEHLLADDVGLNMMLNEHHQTTTCTNVCAPLTAAILARQSRKGRICILGNPIANRGDPIRIAEEMAMIDVMSRGRLEAGFVRGVPYEIPAANTNPTQTLERLWEGVDLVQRAWTSHDEPFSYEGRFFQHRMVNVWPRCYQDPHPQIWITGSSDLENIAKIAGQGFVFATFLQPHDKVRAMFDAYRAAFVDRGLPGAGGVAFMPLVYVGDSESEAEAGARELMWYLNVPSEPQFRNPPGYVDVKTNVLALKGAFAGRTAAMRTRGMDFLREQGVMIYGTPDQCIEQIKRLYERVGGMDHLLMMMQAGHLDNKRTEANIRRFAKDVYPAIKGLARSKSRPWVEAAE